MTRARARILLLTLVVGAFGTASSITLTGLKCGPYATLDGPCPVPGACLLNSSNANCVTWESCTLSVDSAAQQGQHSKSRCNSFDDGNGTFINNQWRTTTCNVTDAWLSPDELHFRLQQRHVIISGDSMMRQIFMRLVWHLRGFDYIAEHHFHRDAIYIRNSTHDLFWQSLPEKHFRPGDIKYHYHKHQAEPYKLEVTQADHPSQSGDIESPDFVIQFVWDIDSRRTAYADVLKAFQDSGTRHGVYIAGIHYWRHDDCTDGIDSDALVNISQAGHPARRTQVYYVNTPKRPQNQGQNQSHSADLPDIWVRRNAYFRALAPQFQGIIIPFDKMAAVDHFPHADTTHFQCKFSNEFPLAALVRGFHKPPRFKQPGGVDCSDWMNLNIVQMIASSCC